MKMLKMLIAPAMTAAFFCVGPVAAHELPPIYDRINFQVQESKDVDNDTLVAVMYYERSGQQPTAMADEVNKTIAWAVESAKRSESVKVQTLGYRQEPLYKNQSIAGWKVRQSIRLESTDAPALSALIGELQQRLSIASLQYTVSPEVRRQVEERLIVQGLARFKGRAKLITDELGRPDYRLVNVDINTSGETVMPVRMRTMSTMAESSSVAPPTLEAGTQTISVQISGSIELELGR